MNKNGKNRREWVKTAAIVFLSVMLVLTFFSNTIMNYSLPEVAAQYVQSGTITAKIRGSGVVESGDPYNIMVKETRKVTSVAVKKGDQVQKGDVLVYLEDSESKELEEAEDKLDAARDAYDLALLAADVNAQVLQNTNSNTSVMSYRQQINNAQTEVEKAKDKVKELQNVCDDLDKQLAQVPTNSANVKEEKEAYEDAKEAKENADFALTDAQNALDSINRQITYYEGIYEASVSSGNINTDASDVLERLTVQKNEAQVNVNHASTAAANAQLAYDRAKTAYDNKIASGDTTGKVADLQDRQKVAQANLKEAEKTLTQKKEDADLLTQNIAKTLNLESLYEAIVKAQEDVDKLEENAIGGCVVADVAGTVTAINVVAGEEVSASEPVAVLQPEGKGYSMSFSVTNDQAKRLAVGDVADLVNAWYYDNLTVTLASIKPDTTEPGQKKLLTFDVSGDVTAGQTLNVSVGQKSANYDLIVPNSAIREDNNGKFVLTVESKSSPLGNRYIATRVDVEVLASDDTQSAISGGLYGYEFIITTSTKPIEAGKQVRLADN